MRNSVGFFGMALFAASTVLCAAKAVHYYRAWKDVQVHPVHDRVFGNANQALERAAAARLVLFGDSRIAQWDPLPDLGNTQLVNRGIGGETTEQMRFRFERDVLALEPDWVLFQAGINDLVAANLQGANGAAIARRAAENLTKFVQVSLERNIRVVILSVVPPSRRDPIRFLLWPNALDGYVEDLNAALKPISENAEVVWIDTRAVLQDEAGAWLPGVNADTLHLTRAGYSLLNRAVESVLESRRDAVQ